MQIRPTTPADFAKIWPIFAEVVAAGDTFEYAPNTSKDTAEKLWMGQPNQTFVAEEDGEVLGTYYIKPNRYGLGSHVSNCGYMVSSKARGRGVATTMCKHSQKTAIELGYKAMQFNFVIARNTAAVHLWTKLGFTTIGILPKAYNHAIYGYVDAKIMYKWLAV